MTDPETPCLCGHVLDAHDGGECWTDPDNHDHPDIKCPCWGFTPATGQQD